MTSPFGSSAPLIRARHHAYTGEVKSRALHFVRKRAIVRKGVGCTPVFDEGEVQLMQFRGPPHADPLTTNRAWPLGDGPLAPSIPLAMAMALDTAFAEPENRPGRMRQTLAVLVAHRGRLVAECYASGVDKDSRLLSWSDAKSVLTALIGAAEFEGRLERFAPAPVPEWRGADDPRGAITIDQLLGMSSGLAFDEDYGGTNDASRPYVVIVPSKELVIIRLGLTESESDKLQEIEELIGTTIEAVCNFAH